MMELLIAMAGMYVVVAAAGIWMRTKRNRLTASGSATDRGGTN
ncbi:hypothetical protein BH23ACT5_BH23ACT5_13370 [soil metagenome]